MNATTIEHKTRFLNGRDYWVVKTPANSQYTVFRDGEMCCLQTIIDYYGKRPGSGTRITAKSVFDRVMVKKAIDELVEKTTLERTDIVDDSYVNPTVTLVDKDTTLLALIYEALGNTYKKKLSMRHIDYYLDWKRKGEEEATNDTDPEANDTDPEANDIETNKLTVRVRTISILYCRYWTLQNSAQWGRLSTQ